MELDVIETSFKNWYVQLIVVCNIITIVIYSHPGDYSENITTTNISHSTVYHHL